MIEFQLSEIDNVALKIWQQYRQHNIWAFNAPMGAGKTTLIHAICLILKVTDSVSSPTFAIINEYKSPVAGIIYHMDWYRLKNDNEVISAGCEDCLESGNICFVEWAEKAPHILPPDTLQLNLEIINDTKRRLIVKNKTA
jgi:tRNA threonylcarbamoyladenosine biosynthesis protein TsaE